MSRSLAALTFLVSFSVIFFAAVGESQGIKYTPQQASEIGLELISFVGSGGSWYANSFASLALA